MADNSVSIVMKLNDEISGKLKTIASTSQGYSRAMEELARKGQQLGDRYRDLTKRSAEASSKALEVKRAMDEAAKAFKKSGDEADRLTFERLREEYNDLTVSAKGYADEAKNTVKEVRALSDEVRKMDSAGGGQNVSGGLSAGVSDGGVIQKIGTAGLFNLYEITGNLLAAFVVGLLAYLAPKAKAWFLANMDAAAQENIRNLVQSFTRAAEQLYHDQDPDVTRRRFVKER